LVGILTSNVAYLKRRIERLVARSARTARQKTGSDDERVKGNVIVAVWAPFTRSMSGTAASPKRPTPNVVANISAADAINAPAMPKAGWQRAASRNRTGSTIATGLNRSQDAVSWLML
jgi:hypothetical protein